MAIAKVQEAFVNSGIGNGSGNLSQTITLTGVTAGNDLLLYVVWYVTGSGVPTISVADSVSGTWSTIVTQHVFGSDTEGIYLCQSSPGGSVTVTVTSNKAANASGGLSFWLSEWSGMGGVDQAPAGTTGNSTTATSPTVTPTVGNELIVMCALLNSGATANPSAPWTAENGGTWFAVADRAPLAYQVQVGTGGASTSWSLASGLWGVLGASFFQASAASAAGNMFTFVRGAGPF